MSSSRDLSCEWNCSDEMIAYWYLPRLIASSLQKSKCKFSKKSCVSRCEFKPCIRLKLFWLTQKYSASFRLFGLPKLSNNWMPLLDSSFLLLKRNSCSDVVPVFSNPMWRINSKAPFSADQLFRFCLWKLAQTFPLSFQFGLIAPQYWHKLPKTKIND